MTLKEQAQRTIKKYGMLDHVGNVVVGVSGGADSMALLHILLSLSREAPGPRILAAHVQHHLRGAEAREDEAYVRHICKEWGVPLFVHEEDIAALAERRKTGLEETGRQVRYAYLEEIAARHAPCRIATAHNRKDNMETVLLHLTRGCGLKGAAGIPPVRGAIIRPLLFCAREDIEAYCREQGIVYRQDSTNGDVAYSRNRIRREVLPSLTQINTGAEEAFLRFSLAARQDDDCLRELAVALVETAKTEKHSYNTASLLAAHPAIRSRALAEIVRREGGGVCEARHIDWLEKLLEGKDKPQSESVNIRRYVGNFDLYEGAVYNKRKIMQLGSYRQKENADMDWKMLKELYPELRAYSPVVEKAQVKGAPMYRLIIRQENGGLMDLCNKLRADKTDCLLR